MAVASLAMVAAVAQASIPPWTCAQLMLGAPTLDQLRDRVIAVHATKILPLDGTMHTRAYKGSALEDQPLLFRPTLHFALGELVRPHRNGDWNDSPFAVLAPLRTLEPQLVNLHPYDTFTLGDLAVDESMAIVVPSSYDGPVPPRASIVRYDGPLRIAVEKWIEARDAWPFRMCDGVCDHLAPTTVEGRAVEQSFFQSLFDSRPGLSYGSHTMSVEGAAWHLGVLQFIAMDLRSHYSSFGSKLSVPMLRAIRFTGRWNMARVEEAFAAMSMPASARTDFDSALSAFRRLMAIVDLDLRLATVGVTLGRPPDAIATMIQDREVSVQTIESAADRLEAAHNEAAVGDVFRFAAYFVGVASSKFGGLLNEMTSELGPGFWSLDSVRAKQMLIRIMQSSRSAAMAEGLYASFETAFVQWTKEAGEEDAAKHVFDVLSKELAELAIRFDVSLDVLSMPPVADALSALWKQPLPSNRRLSLADILAANPHTRADRFVGAEFESPPLFGMTQQWLESAWSSDTEPTIPADSFLAARYASREVQTMRQFRAKLARECMIPMRDVAGARVQVGSELTLVELMREPHSQISVAGILDELSIRESFRREFPTDEEFFRSPKSLDQILRELAP